MLHRALLFVSRQTHLAWQILTCSLTTGCEQWKQANEAVSNHQADIYGIEVNEVFIVSPKLK